MFKSVAEAWEDYLEEIRPEDPEEDKEIWLVGFVTAVRIIADGAMTIEQLKAETETIGLGVFGPPI